MKRRTVAMEGSSGSWHEKGAGRGSRKVVGMSPSTSWIPRWPRESSVSKKSLAWDLRQQTYLDAGFLSNGWDGSRAGHGQEVRVLALGKM